MVRKDESREFFRDKVMMGLEIWMGTLLCSSRQYLSASSYIRMRRARFNYQACKSGNPSTILCERKCFCRHFCRSLFFCNLTAFFFNLSQLYRQCVTSKSSDHFGLYHRTLTAFDRKIKHFCSKNVNNWIKRSCNNSV